MVVVQGKFGASVKASLTCGLPYAIIGSDSLNFYQPRPPVFGHPSLLWRLDNEDQSQGWRNGWPA